MRMQTIIACDADGRVIDAFDLVSGKTRKPHNITPRKVKKMLLRCVGVASVRRITTHTIERAEP